MASSASSVAKQLRYKIESTFGVAAGASGAQLLRRVESTLNLSKDVYQSNEIRSDYQISDMRHGVRKVGGIIKGELSAKTYSDLFAAALRRDFTAVAALTGLTITVAGSGPYTLTRSAGSYLTDGVKIGDVVRLTAGAFNAANLNKNILVTGLTATILTGIVLNAVALVTEGPIATATLAVVGKKTYIPTSGHTDKSFSFEHWFGDIAQSELFTGCKVNTISVDLPPTGMAIFNSDIIGQNITTNTAQYFTSPTAMTTTGINAAVNGVLMANGVQQSIVTNLSLKIDTGNNPEDAAVGSNITPGIIQGVVKVSGTFTAYFQDATLRDYFLNETEISLVVALVSDNTAASDFVAFSLPRLKVGSADRGDGDKGILATFAFTGLYNGAGGAGTSSEQTTLVVQDSQA